MAVLNKTIPDELHRRLKIRAAERGITLQALVIELLSIGLHEDNYEPED